MRAKNCYITSFTYDTITTYPRQIVIHPLVNACTYVGEWPLVINVRTAFTAGNHSVSITAADSIGLSARNIVPFTLVDTTRTNREKDYFCSIVYIPYTILIKFILMILEEQMCYENVYLPNVLHDESFDYIQEYATCNHKKFSYCWCVTNF